MRLSELKTPMPPAGAIDDREVTAALDKFRGLLSDAQAASEAAWEAERELDAARERDADAYAAALAAGNPDPGRKALEKAGANLDATRRHAEAAMRAADLARTDLAATVAERREALEEAAFGRTLAAERTFGEALLAAEEAFGELEAAKAAAAWLAGFPDGRVKPPQSRLIGMLDRAGEPYHAAAALAALRELAGGPDREPATA